jgi:hypothetical protein
VIVFQEVEAEPIPWSKISGSPDPEDSNASFTVVTLLCLIAGHFMSGSEGCDHRAERKILQQIRYIENPQKMSAILSAIHSVRNSLAPFEIVILYYRLHRS